MKDVMVRVPGGSINTWHRPASRDAPTTALVHGLTGNSRWWTAVIDHLPPELGVIALDVRGRGASSDAPAPFDLATIADDILRCLDHFSVERALVAGYSMGAWIAAVVGDKHPQRVTRLILVDGGFPIPNPDGVDADEMVEAVVGPALARLGVVFASRQDFYDHWRSHPALAGHWDERMEGYLDFELTPGGGGHMVRINPEAVEVGAREMTVDPRTNDAGARVSVPTHVLVVERGTADQEGGMIPVNTVADALSKNTSISMEYLPGLNHYTLVLGLGAPAVAAAITSGLTGVSSPPGH